uniref:Uncharacterized protein n=1 Tax=Anas platyrhynchos TaxID=8839 RepID=A0A8B9TG36_ANAPL
MGWGQGPRTVLSWLCPTRGSSGRAVTGGIPCTPCPRHTHHAKSTQAYMMAAPRTATVVSSVCSSSCRVPGKQTVRFCPFPQPPAPVPGPYPLWSCARQSVLERTLRSRAACSRWKQAVPKQTRYTAEEPTSRSQSVPPGRCWHSTGWGGLC